MIKVLIERCSKPGKEQALEGLLKDLRAASLHEPGYVSGETLIGLDDPTSFLVISTWSRLEAWNAWKNSQARLDLIDLVTPLLTGEPTVRIYNVPVDEE